MDEVEAEAHQPGRDPGMGLSFTGMPCPQERREVPQWGAVGDEQVQEQTLSQVTSSFTEGSHCLRLY